MKKTIIKLLIFMTIICGTFSLVACSNTNKNEKMEIVVTIFPEYDWVMSVLGNNKDNAEVKLLLDNGADLHNYQPSIDDIAKISSCDLFIYVGGESDEWVDDALDNAVNKDMKVINLLEVLGDKAKVEEIIEGMEGEEEEEEEAIEYDEHVWLSLKNAQLFVNEISKVLGEIDKENMAVYNENASKYNESLLALDEQYKEAISNAQIKTILFGDRFPFRYLVDDYSLSYYAAFVGCSAETEASFETIIFLSRKVDELGLKTIMIIESSDGKIANAIKNNTLTKDQKILTMDSLQSETLKEYQAGKTYVKVMQENLAALIEALK